MHSNQLNLFNNYPDSSDVISISDSRIGIPPEKLKDIFDKFSQTDQNIKESADGSGLGLSVVKMLVEHHGGKITAESIIGKGSSFQINLSN